jgi:hypothetical protein
VCVYSFRYPACNAHAPYCHMWPFLLYDIFTTLSHKWQEFLETLLNMSACFEFSNILRRIKLQMIKYVSSIRTSRMYYFILNLFLQLNSTRFQQVYCSSSGDTLYVQQLVCVMRLCWLATRGILPKPVDIHAWLYQLLYIQSSTSWWWAVSLFETRRG